MSRNLSPACEDLLARALGPEVRLQNDLPPDLPAVLIDANQLELALLNLAVNARDAMPDGGLLIFSAAEADGSDKDAPTELKPGQYLRISVVDTGRGMDEATLARAAEPFFTTKGRRQRHRPRSVDGAGPRGAIGRRAASCKRAGQRRADRSLAAAGRSPRDRARSANEDVTQPITSRGLAQCSLSTTTYWSRRARPRCWKIWVTPSSRQTRPPTR